MQVLSDVLTRNNARSWLTARNGQCRLAGPAPLPIRPSPTFETDFNRVELCDPQSAGERATPSHANVRRASVVVLCDGGSVVRAEVSERTV